MHPNTAKERISLAYMNLIASLAKSELSETKVDIDGVDCMIIHPGSVEGGIVTGTQINFQVKSTQNWKIENGYVVYELEVKNYEKLIGNFQIPTILAVFLFPREINLTHNCTTERIILRHTAYWINLNGLDETENKFSITIRIPEKNHFNLETLYRMHFNLSHGMEFDHDL